MGELILAGVEWRYLQDLPEPFCDSHFTELQGTVTPTPPCFCW